VSWLRFPSRFVKSFKYLNFIEYKFTSTIGLDGRFIEPDSYPCICQARAWILTLGFTLSYGAMFSKVWRVHRLTTKSKQDAKVLPLTSSL
jgi:hypothetical protein